MTFAHVNLPASRLLMPARWHFGGILSVPLGRADHGSRARLTFHLFICFCFCFFLHFLPSSGEVIKSGRKMSSSSSGSKWEQFQYSISQGSDLVQCLMGTHQALFCNNNNNVNNNYKTIIIIFIFRWHTSRLICLLICSETKSHHISLLTYREIQFKTLFFSTKKNLKVNQFKKIFGDPVGLLKQKKKSHCLLNIMFLNNALEGQQSLPETTLVSG